MAGFIVQRSGQRCSSVQLGAISEIAREPSVPFDYFWRRRA
jgi:hypothetical protein